jgi:hypothetical protein
LPVLREPVVITPPERRRVDFLASCGPEDPSQALRFEPSGHSIEDLDAGFAQRQFFRRAPALRARWIPAFAGLSPE